MPNASSIMSTQAPDASKPSKKTRRSNKANTKQTRRRRRPSTASKSDESTATSCTLPTVSSNESLDCSLDTSIDHHHNSPPRKSRRRPRKSKQAAPKQVQITELTPQEKARYIGLDAEMVGILDSRGRHSSALARISLVDWNGESIFDTYVKVTQPIVDYRTFVSGITPEHLNREDALPILEVRRIVGELIHDKIVVGHGLKNDFRALGLVHPWHLVRDSAKYLPFMKACPLTGEKIAKKLKTLALDKLGMIIQCEGEAHDPNEDAIAAMELYKKHRKKWERVVEWKMERTRGIEENGAEMLWTDSSFEVY
jgi:RNA exonuclease 4